jgi:hypothetical protein
MLIFGVMMWVLNRYCPLLIIIPKAWNWLGWGVMAMALIAPIAAFRQFRRAHTTIDPHKPETKCRTGQRLQVAVQRGRSSFRPGLMSASCTQ